MIDCIVKTRNKRAVEVAAVAGRGRSRRLCRVSSPHVRAREVRTESEKYKFDRARVYHRRVICYTAKRILMFLYDRYNNNNNIVIMRNNAVRSYTRTFRNKHATPRR